MFPFISPSRTSTLRVPSVLGIHSGILALRSSIRVLDAHGNPLPDNARQGMNLCSGHGFGPNKEFSQGKLYPIERSLTNEGWLPKEPGTYTIVVTWTPLIGSNHECTSVEARANFKVAPAA